MSIIISETKDGFNIYDYGWDNYPDDKIQSHIKEVASSTSYDSSIPNDIKDLLRGIKECVDVDGGFDHKNTFLFQKLEEVLVRMKD